MLCKTYVHLASQHQCVLSVINSVYFCFFALLALLEPQHFQNYVQSNSSIGTCFIVPRSTRLPFYLHTIVGFETFFIDGICFDNESLTAYIIVSRCLLFKRINQIQWITLDVCFICCCYCCDCRRSNQTYCGCRWRHRNSRNTMVGLVCFVFKSIFESLWNYFIEIS